MIRIRPDSALPGLLCALSRNTPSRLYYSAIKPRYQNDWQRAAINHLNENNWELTALLPEAEATMALLISYRVSQFNDTLAPLPDWLDLLPANQWILLVDELEREDPTQTQRFEALVATVLDQWPAEQLAIKRVPKRSPQTEQGVLEKRLANNPRIRWVDADCSSWDVLDRVGTVCTVESHTGFEALMLGKRVMVFGQPWYAGWGLTEDQQALEHPRLRTATLTELFAVVYLQICEYYNPHTRDRATLTTVLDLLWHQKRVNQRNSGLIQCFKLGQWRGKRIRPFLQSTANQVDFYKTLPEAKARQTNGQKVSQIYVWGFTQVPGLTDYRDEQKARLGRIEDAFIRSVGLGSDLIRPDSLAIDPMGIYYDPQHPSELEHLLQHHRFTPHLLERARRLKDLILTHDLSKYNVEYDTRPGFVPPVDRKVILIPSQIEDDASVLRGCPGIRDNLSLLKAVRQAEPDAYIIYKVHPDVVAGNRHGHLNEETLLTYADVISYRDNIIKLIHQCDEVHTMTSLSGFEALLRNKVVVAYGLPFYAGWGLTRDQHQLSRRTRKLSLDELVAATLILYPTYLDWSTGLIDIPENVVNRQIRRLQRQLPWPIDQAYSGLGRLIFQISRGMRRHYRHVRSRYVAKTTLDPWTALPSTLSSASNTETGPLLTTDCSDNQS